MVVQPDGTVTLLFTDIEGSTRLLDRLGVEGYSEVLELHRRLLRDSFSANAGFEVDTTGDGFFVAFSRADDAVAAAAEGQRALAVAGWPRSTQLRVRMGIHTGEPRPVASNYVGIDVHRAARIMSAAHGSQVLVSETTAALLSGVALRDLGSHRLKDLLEPIGLYQLDVDGMESTFPPLRSLHRSNLPLAAWPLLGRERELDAIRTLLRSGVRVLTLTGPGGSGKTRLALQAAAELSEEFVDGVFFIPLAPLRETKAVHAAVAQAVGLHPDDDVLAWLASKSTLLVLDNLEHLQGVAALVSELVVGEVVVLATSRAPLHLSAERELRVEPLADAAAVELFVSRAARAGRHVEADETVAAVCRRLDNLPLALELAAARVRLLSPEALLQRLDAALSLLVGGAVDLPERQRTMRATLEWSHDLLDAEAQAVYRRLSMFRGSFTIDAAGAVAGAGLEQLEALLDQSLLKPLGDDRFFLLETLREYARERLDEAGETGEYALRHARWYLARLEELEPVRIGPRTPEVLAWYAAEQDNLRAMLDRLAERLPGEAARAAVLLSPYWIARGQLHEGQSRLLALLATDLPTGARAALLQRLADVVAQLGHVDAAETAAEEAIDLANSEGDRRTLSWALRAWGHAAYRRGDADEAVRRCRLALEEATALGDTQVRSICLSDLGLYLTAAGRDDEARVTLRAAVDEHRRLGSTVNEAISTLNLAELDLYAGDFDAAQRGYAASLITMREAGFLTYLPTTGLGLGRALLGAGRRTEALAALRTAMNLAQENGVVREVYDTLGAVALAADKTDLPAAARIRGAVALMRQREGVSSDPRDEELERRFEQPLIQTLGKQAWERELATGSAMTLDQTVELARLICRD